MIQRFFVNAIDTFEKLLLVLEVTLTWVSMQAVSKHIRVLTDAGLVSQRKDAQRRPCHLEAQVFDLMTKWIERYRLQAEERYERLDAVLAEMRDGARPDHPHRQQGAAS